MDDRVAIYIDGNNMLYTLKELGWYIDWLKVRDYYAKKYNLVSANFYRSYSVHPTEEEIRFGRFLAISGFALVEKQVKRISDSKSEKYIYKGNLDIELVTDALSSSHLYDIFVLFSGDGDFVPLIRSLKSKGKIVKVVSSKVASAIEILQVVGMDFDDLSDLRPILEYTTRKSKDKNHISPHTEHVDKIAESESIYPSIGDQFETSVSYEATYGVFLKNKWGIKMLLPASELAINEYVSDVAKLFTRKDRFNVEVVNVDSNPSDPNSKARLIDKDMIEILKKRYYDSLPDLPKVGEKLELRVDSVLDYGVFFENPFLARIFLPINLVKSTLKREIFDLNDLFSEGESVPVTIIAIYSVSERRLTATIDEPSYLDKLKEKLESLF